MAQEPSKDETILRVTSALLVMAGVALAGLTLVGSLDAGVGIPEAVHGATSYEVVLVAFAVAGIWARRS